MATPAEHLPAPAPAPSHSGVTFGSGQVTDATASRHLILIDQMIAWQIANPGKPWTQCAQALGLSALWCRMVASSDAFKARYAECKDGIIKEIGLLGLKERIAAAAEVAVERLAEKASVCDSMGELTDAAEVLLKAHYGDSKSPGASPVSLTVNNTILAARDRIMAGPVPAPPAPIEAKPA